MAGKGNAVCIGRRCVAPSVSRFNSLDGRVLMNSNKGQDRREVVGIVVSRGVEEEKRPRAVAFVWGGQVRPAPSLPYGRWKNEVRSAA